MTIYPRHIENIFQSPVSHGKVRLLFGARQTGKSTLLNRLASSDTVTFNLQERKTRLEMERNPSAFTQILEANTDGVTIVHVDEIQRVPALLDEIQYVFDRYRNRFGFLLTGSSARKLKKASANLLPGRAHIYHLCPLILQERQHSKAGRIFPLPVSGTCRPGFPEPSLDDLLLYGNLPGIIKESPQARLKTLESYVELYLEEEIRREALAHDLGAFQQFLELSALESGHMVNLANLSRESGIAASTLSTFYQVLEDTFVGYRIPAFGSTGRKRVLTTPRFLYFDTGVRNAAARLRIDKDLLKTQVGQLLENWVGQELVQRCLYAGRPYRVSYWRTTHGAEVDYVLETPDEVIPIEVKATDTPSLHDARHITLFLDTYPEKARRGCVVCRCREPRKLTERIEAIPWEMV